MIKNKSFFYILSGILFVLIFFIILNFNTIFCDLDCNQRKMVSMRKCDLKMEYDLNLNTSTIQQKNEYMKYCMNAAEQSYKKQIREEKLKK